MNHLIICREYPPAPGGGIGTYVLHISRLLAESGETVHVIGQLWKGAEKEIEEDCHGRLIIHRVPFENWGSRCGRPRVRSKEGKALFESSFLPQCFSWEAGLLAERLIDQEGIDIIEAQDYEAPIYYLQLRRALGLGPKRLPPCLIHLHSPIEFLARYNDSDSSHPYFVTEKRLEDYTIAAADALLCPSRYLTNQAEAHYGLKKGSIHIIPYPLGESRVIERDKKTWEQGTICYLGRLERRKGVIEWIDAAVSVAPEYPEARFEFIGGNSLGNDPVSAKAFVESRIPEDLRHQFLFRGAQSRSKLSTFLAGARISVVPSRWENFPNTCIEAMCSGLPVIASRNGGMVEMIQDGQTGWLVSEAGPEGLAATLRQALRTAPQGIEEMGRKASEDIRRMCGNTKVLESHLNLRAKVIKQGSSRSLHLAVNLPWAKSAFSDEPVRVPRKNSQQEGLAIVVTCKENGGYLEKCLESVNHQVRKPAGVVIVHGGSNEGRTSKALKLARKEGWQVIDRKIEGFGSAKNAGIEAVLGSGLNPVGFVFLGAEDRLHPEFVDACESTLQRCPEVGLVSCWAGHRDANNKIWTAACPCFPYQWVSNDVGPFSAVRTDALQEAGNFRPMMNHGYEDWDLANAVMAAGWKAVTVPGILIDHWFEGDSPQPITDVHGSGGMPREILERFPELVARDARDIILMAGSLLRVELLARREELVAVRTMPRHLRGAVLQILKKVRNSLIKP